MSTNDTEPITHEDVARTMTTVATAMVSVSELLLDIVDGEGSTAYPNPNTLRTLADLLAERTHRNAALILRRAADQIDPPPAPAEPDLNTPEGWLTTCAVKDYDPRLVVLPGGDAQRSALVATWGMTEADAPEFPWLASCIAADAFGLSKHQ